MLTAVLRTYSLPLRQEVIADPTEQRVWICCQER
jgi:hypothetical protein